MRAWVMARSAKRFTGPMRFFNYAFERGGSAMRRALPKMSSESTLPAKTWQKLS